MKATVDTTLTNLGFVDDVFVQEDIPSNALPIYRTQGFVTLIGDDAEQVLMVDNAKTFVPYFELHASDLGESWGGDPCSECEGSGKIDMVFHYDECSECGGSGCDSDPIVEMAAALGAQVRETALHLLSGSSVTAVRPEAKYDDLDKALDGWDPDVVIMHCKDADPEGGGWASRLSSGRVMNKWMSKGVKIHVENNEIVPGTMFLLQSGFGKMPVDRIYSVWENDECVDMVAGMGLCGLNLECLRRVEV